jgi:hypothetical protein
MVIYLIPNDTKLPIIAGELQVSDCYSNTRQSIDWTIETNYRECKIPLGTGFTEWMGVARNGAP